MGMQTMTVVMGMEPTEGEAIFSGGIGLKRAAEVPASIQLGQNEN